MDNEVWHVNVPLLLWDGEVGVQGFPFKEKYVIPRLLT